jgi:hypothetical protein
MPSDDYMRSFLTGITPTIAGEITMLEANIRDTVVRQPAYANHNTGTVMFQFTDDDRQNIAYFLTELRYASYDPDFGYSMNKDHLVFPEINVWQTNRNRGIIKHLRFWDCYATNIVINDGPLNSGTPNQLSDCSVTFQSQKAYRLI